MIDFVMRSVLVMSLLLFSVTLVFCDRTRCAQCSCDVAVFSVTLIFCNQFCFVFSFFFFSFCNVSVL